MDQPINLTPHSGMAHSGEIDIAYEVFGVAKDPAILLIMGVGTPASLWPDELIHPLVAAGYRVIRFDQRDIGESTRLDHLGYPNMAALALWHFTRSTFWSRRTPYTLNDMAGDALSVMDAVGVDDAHMVGISMGGMIAQLIAGERPQRVRSLTCWSSSSGRRGLPLPKNRVRMASLNQPWRAFNDAGCVEHGLNMWRAIGSPEYTKNEPEARALIEQMVAGGMRASAVSRHLAAVVADGSRVEMLQALEVPTLVLHGDADVLIPIEHGHDLADSIPNARFVSIPGLGHDFPVPLMPDISARILEHIEATDAP